MHTLTFSQHRLLAQSWLGRVLMVLLLAGASFSSFAQTVTSPDVTGPDVIFVNTTKNPNGATTNYAAKGASGTSFSGANLGTYLLSTPSGDEQLFFQGGRIITTEPTNANTAIRFKSAQIYYRVYEQGNRGNTAFTVLEIPESVTPVVNGNTTTRTFELNSAVANIDLVSAVSGAGTYDVEIYLQGTYDNGNGTNTLVKDNNGNINYRATFVVQGTRANTTTWNGSSSDNWFDASNWSSGVPTATRDAFIRYPNPGALVPYPRIFANGQYTTTNTNNPYAGQAYGNAEVNNLSFGGTSATTRATLTLVTGNLLIYGSLTNNFDNISQSDNTVIVFAGTANTDITGGGTFKTVHVAGGGVKTLTGNMRIGTELRFGSSLVSGLGNIAVTGGNNNNVVTLQNISNSMAMLVGETDNGYVSGLMNTQAEAIPGVPQTFGNIGITLTFIGNAPGQVSINRVVGQSYNGANSNNPFSVSVKRSFEVKPANLNTTNGGLNAKLVFNYLDNERKNVGASSVEVNEAQLYLAYSNNTTSFDAVGNNTVRDQIGNTVTTDNVTAFGGVFTLADAQNPLPVSLVAFSAKRVGDAALITWATAMERNNRGFEVEVSTDGINFRTLGFVASNSPDSNKRLEYTFSDKEANKSGIRYYRLHQLDLNGKDDYSPVRAVSFAAAGEGIAALSAYPNPFSSDEIKLALQSSEAGQASLRVTDLTGRPVSSQTFTAVKGVTEVNIDQAAQLAAGSYLAQITAPSGEVKTIRIQKR